MRMTSWSYIAKSEQETQKLGVHLGQLLQSNSVIALTGDLGAGKTRFVQAVACGLEVAEDTVNSPTYVLIQQYAGRLTIYHFDTYRLADSDEFLALGAEELFTAGGVCLIEWADRVQDLLPRETLQVKIQVISPTGREFHFEATDAQHGGLIRQLAERYHDPQL